MLTNNGPLIQSRIIKCWKITAWNWFLLPSFTPYFLALCGSSFQSVFPFTRLFSSFAQKNESCMFLYSPIALASWEHFGGSFFSSAMNVLKRVDGLTMAKEEEMEEGGSKELCRFWRVHDSQSQTDLFLCLRSSFLLCFKLEELVGWKGTESWARSLKTAQAACFLTVIKCVIPHLWHTQNLA